MLQKILFVVSATQESLKAAQFVAELALATKAQIIALNVVDSSTAKQITGATGKSETEVLVQLEQDGWRYLYDVEDTCKGLGARIVLQQDEGFPEAKVTSAAKRFKVDLVALPRSRSGGMAQSRGEKALVAIIERVDCPVMVV